MTWNKDKSWCTDRHKKTRPALKWAARGFGGYKMNRWIRRTSSKAFHHSFSAVVAWTWMPKSYTEAFDSLPESTDLDCSQVHTTGRMLKGRWWSKRRETRVCLRTMTKYVPNTSQSPRRTRCRPEAVAPQRRRPKMMRSKIFFYNSMHNTTAKSHRT